MNVIRVVKDKNFTIINNTIFKDKKISCKAKGFFATIMSLPDDWDFSVNGIKSILLEGKSSVYSFIDELEANGYLIKNTSRDERGKILGIKYTFFETPINKGVSPQTDLQETALQETVEPLTANQPQLSTNIIKDLNNKTNTPFCGFPNHETDSVKYSKETKSQSELLSKTNKDDLDETTKIYFDIAIGFQRLFIHNKKQLGLNNFKDQENATFKSYVEPIRLAIERDGMTRDDFAKIFIFLKEDEFWMKNIMSVSKLREKMGDLLIKASNLKKKPTTLPSDWFSRELTKEQIELLTDKQKKSWEHNKSVIAIEGGYLKPIIK